MTYRYNSVSRSLEPVGIAWGRYRENGVWLAPDWHWRLLLGGGDRIIFAALGRLRFRLVWPRGDR